MDGVTVDQSQPAKQVPQMRSAVEEYRARMGRLLDLNEAQKTRLMEFLKNNVQGWQQDTSTLHARLRDDNDLVEGVVMDTGFPWEGASIVHVPITETYMEVYHSVMRRSILGAGILWVTTTDDDMLREHTDDVADAMNDKAFNEWNVEEAVEGAIWTTCRDGLSAIQATWVELYSPSSDVLIIDSAEEFLREFPSADEAGIEQAEWDDLLAKAGQASPEFPLEIPVNFEKLDYYGNKCDIVELVDFVTFPATVKDIKHESCRGYGKRYDERKAIIRGKGKGEGNLYYPEAVTKLLSDDKGGTAGASVQAQDQVEGLGRSTKSELQLYELVIKFALDPDGEERKLLVTYSADHEILLAVKDYPYRVDCYALFRISKRPNRLVGRSIPQKTRDMNDEIDTMHRQRVNSRTISHVPSFIGDSNKKTEFDKANPDQSFFPGKTWWSPGGARDQAFDQFKVQPVDQGESMTEEQNDMKLLDLLLGSAVSLLSGQPSPEDPNAPGVKVDTLIGQSNLRMDDPLSEFRHGVEDLGDICLSHLYQFGPHVIEYMAKTEAGEETRSLYKKILRTGLRMKMAGVTIAQNPQGEMSKVLKIFEFLMTKWPAFQQNTLGQVEMIRDALRKGRIQRWEKYVPTVEEMQAQMVEVQKQAMLQAQMEQAAAAEQAAAQEEEARLKGARRELEIKKLAEDTARAGMGTNGRA